MFGKNPRFKHNPSCSIVGEKGHPDELCCLRRELQHWPLVKTLTRPFLYLHTSIKHSCSHFSIVPDQRFPMFVLANRQKEACPIHLSKRPIRSATSQFRESVKLCSYPRVVYSDSLPFQSNLPPVSGNDFNTTFFTC